MFRSILLTLPFVSLFACSYQPEEPGQCKLQCSGAIIGGSDETIDGKKVFDIRVATTVPKFSCGPTNAGNPVEGIRADFVVRENLFDQSGQIVGFRPVPNVSLEPVIVGNMAAIDNGETNPAYRGIRTPRDNWCSDACGVATLQVVGTCPAPGTSTEITIQFHSGALYSEPAAIPIETRSPDTM